MRTHISYTRGIGEEAFYRYKRGTEEVRGIVEVQKRYRYSRGTEAV
jgi:hypothetical protein